MPESLLFVEPLEVSSRLLHVMPLDEARLLIDSDLPELRSRYQSWVRSKVFCWFTSGNGGPEGITSKWLLGAKRGDHKYARLVKEKLAAAEKEIGSIEFFNPDDKFEDSNNLHSRLKIQKTNLLYAVLTYDRSHKLLESWNSLKTEVKEVFVDWDLSVKRRYQASAFQKFKARMHKKYGPASVLRSWEDHKDSYPHVNCLILLDRPVDCYFHRKSNTWRLKGKREFEHLWPHGFVDVLPVARFGDQFKRAARDDSNVQSVSHILKYMLKDYAGRKGKSSYLMPILWGLRLRSFALTGKYFKEKLRSLKITIGDLIKESSIIVTLDPLVWEFQGVFPEACRLASKIYGGKPPPGCIYRKENRDSGSLDHADPDDPAAHECVGIIKKYGVEYLRELPEGYEQQWRMEE